MNGYNMHVYASDTVDRRMAPFIIALVAIGISWIIFQIIAASKVIFPWWLEAPSVMGMYGIIYKLYDQLLWHMRIKNIPLSLISDMRGTWCIEIRSSYDDRKYFGVLYLRQSWSKILIELQTEYSRSFSIMANLTEKKSSEMGLKYEYRNEPKSLSESTMAQHKGTTHLRPVLGDKDALEGEYYSDKGRGNFGQMRCERISQRMINYKLAVQQCSVIMNDE